ncbi:response regulator transcription factor [Kushneria phosphatilytica]|uniref:Response regulator transcription factor n=1 Tax=Kushneria phosphatilytica TaxID=657387 RepID=A0A1S1NV39_9GAMM|nr:response regulator transcription factor [Kushneria phosphatilytica]OHV10262.1 DNA-binding response regulator [Kushneria phosphatilytica]QEL11563.1 response regulator transcription factor [Kushneria phosphatilytica]
MALALIEDDELLADTLQTLLSQQGYPVELITRGDTARQRFSADTNVDLIILDLTLPGCSGLEVLETLRCHDRSTPVLILTARASVEDRVRGLDLGADDYLTKPFSLDEFEARIRALLRRQPHSGVGETLRMGTVSFDTRTQRVFIEEQSVALPPRELRLLACLLRHGGDVVERARLNEEAFGCEEAIADNALEVYIHRLRRRLAGSDLTLRTIRGMGYRLEQG